MGKGKFTSVGAAAWEFREKRLDEGDFIPESTHEGDVDVLRRARLAPALDGNAANDTEASPATLAEGLKFLGGFFEDVRQGNHYSRSR